MDITALGLFFLNLAPALIFGILTLLFVPKSMRLLRILIYIILLVLVRDRIISVGAADMFQSVNIFIYSAVPVLIVLAAIFYETEIAGLVMWTKDNIPRVIIAGAVGAIAIGLPVFLAHKFLPLTTGLFTGSLDILPFVILPILVIVFLEEIIFQGFLQGYLEEHIGIAMSAIISGLFFILSYSLVSHYTGIEDLFILLFIALQGFVVAQLQVRFGVASGIIARVIPLVLIFAGII